MIAGLAFLPLAGCGASLTNEPAAFSAAEPLNGPSMTHAASGASLQPAALVPSAVGAPNTASATATDMYRVGPQDVLDISVFKVPELSKTVQVADSGSINLPLVGEIPAAGRTAQDIERDLTKRLGAKYLQSPQVSVFVKEFNSQSVTVDGAVKKPGVYPIRRQTTLMEFIATAGGLDFGTASTDVAVFRTTDGKRSVARFDLADIRDGSQQDPPMQKGDVIIVDTSTSKIVLNSVLRLPLGSFVPLL